MSTIVAAVLLRTQIADALVLRGDEFLVRNKLVQAQVHYQRALWFDDTSTAAVDRTIYVAMLQRGRAELKNAITLASAFLRRFPEDDVVRADRGLCYLLVKKYRLAAKDYDRTAADTHDLQTRIFAHRLDSIARSDPHR
ncbi:MAG TPA: hypothetical protein VGR69_07265 [Candidatus Rubrimentiphilum sp.]|nr:hypothetical protein [Candidatus Rubrimentiphilum sp.]